MSGATAAAAGSGEDLGTRIRRLRLERGLTQQELAGPRYSRGFVAAVESGSRAPSADALRHLARRLGVDVDDLRHGRPPGIAEQLRAELAEARRALSRGELSRVCGDLARIEDDAARYGLPELSSWAAYLRGEVEVHRGDHAAAQRRFDRLADTLPASVPDLAAAVTARRAYCRFVAGDSERAVAMMEEHLRALRAGPDPDPDAVLRVMMSLIYVCIELDLRTRARLLEAEATELVPRVRRREWVAQFLYVVSQLRQGDAEIAEAERMLGTARAIFEELGLERDLAACHWAHGYVLRRAGRLAEAAAAFEQARARLSEVGAVQDHAGVTLELAEARRREGRLADARSLAEEAGAICAASRHLEGAAEADRIMGEVALAAGDDEAAERLLRQAVHRYERTGVFREVVTTARVLGELLLTQHRTAEAMAVLRGGLSNAERLR